MEAAYRASLLAFIALRSLKDWAEVLLLLARDRRHLIAAAATPNRVGLHPTPLFRARFGHPPGL
jgi:hypothetical protein